MTANNSLTLEEGGQIASASRSVGDAGYVVVDTADMSIDGQGSGYFTGLASTAEIGSSGNAGAVVVTASGDVGGIGAGALRRILGKTVMPVRFRWMQALSASTAWVAAYSPALGRMQNRVAAVTRVMRIVKAKMPSHWMMVRKLCLTAT